GALPSTQGAVPQLTGVIGVSVLPVLFPKAGTNVFQVSAMESAVVAPMLAAIRAARMTTIGVLYTTDASGTAQLSTVQQGAAAAGQAAWKTFRAQFRAYAHEPVDSEHASAYYSACVAADALRGTKGGTAADLAAYLSASSVSCLGAPLRFDLPGLNVVDDQPR